MILTNGNHEVCFLHIPRTAGRYAANLLTNSGYDYVNDFPGSGYRIIHYKGKELLHLTLAEEQDLAKTCNRKLPEKKFTIIRNPVDKFLSFSRVYESFIRIGGIGWKEMELPEVLDQVMNSFGFIGGQDGKILEMFFGFRNMGNNSCVDQREFIDDSVKIWKFEDGLGKPFVEWLNDEVGLEVKQSQVTYNKKSYDNHQYEFSDALRNNLANYFKDEMIYFNY